MVFTRITKLKKKCPSDIWIQAAMYDLHYEVNATNAK
jgi:hypothetical protein